MTMQYIDKTYLSPGNPATYSLGVESLTWPLLVSNPFLIISFLSAACYMCANEITSNGKHKVQTALQLKCLPVDRRPSKEEASLMGNFNLSRFTNNFNLLMKRDVILMLRLKATFGPLPHCLG